MLLCYWLMSVLSHSRDAKAEFCSLMIVNTYHFVPSGPHLIVMMLCDFFCFWHSHVKCSEVLQL